ncbi:GPI transamidase subunit PIG-U [Purpureocillium lilacinum]|uniref:GPI transamidase subunit PIG-U n=1 Tax=Purpureocillium lilacinum TaxID=33203 RepID=A0A179GN24_PURLI|nr:GPI transamidase subunit PIG-U [Purpureocillium lilacinum]OAQ79306.1 GPI transamidase subunit PIG-U [Purpureocillium lilacinum]
MAATTTMTLRGRAGVYAGAALLRLVLTLAFPGLPDLLTGRVEISTPVTSFKLQEGLFLYNHNVWPYDGGVYHQAPLLLPLFSLLPDVKAWPIFTSLLYIAVDLLSADALARIADSGEAGQSRLFTSPRRAKRASGLLVAAVSLQPLHDRDLHRPLHKRLHNMRHPSRHRQGHLRLSLQRHGRPVVRVVPLHVPAPPPAAARPAGLRPPAREAPGDMHRQVRRQVRRRGGGLPRRAAGHVVCPDGQLVGVPRPHVRHPAHTLGPDAQRRPLVVLLHRDVRLVPRLLPRRLLAAPVRLRRRPLHTPARPAPRRADAPAGHLRHLQALPVHLRHQPLPRHAAPLRPRPAPHALHVRRLGHDPVRDVPRPGLLPPVDLRRQRQRKLLLRHHAGVEPGPEPPGVGLDICGLARRVGGGAARDDWQGGQADIGRARHKKTDHGQRVHSAIKSFVTTLASRRHRCGHKK